MIYHKEETVHIDPESYGCFLDIISRHFTVKPLREYIEETEDKVCLLRHDVDSGAGGGLWGAMQMADIEHKRGIRSSYYVVHNVRYYWRDRGRLIKKCRQLAKMGHEVGLHQDLLSVCLQTASQRPRDLFEYELNFLRTNGLYISGVSSHGSRFAKEHGVFSTQVFKECQPTDPAEHRDDVNGVPLKTIQLFDYDLYEASLIPVDYYISDSNGRWKTTERREPVFPITNKAIPRGDFERYIEKLGEDDDVQKIMILTHPGVWYREKYGAFRLPFGGLK